jgi:hypothetical protein
MIAGSSSFLGLSSRSAESGFSSVGFIGGRPSSENGSAGLMDDARRKSPATIGKGGGLRLRALQNGDDREWHRAENETPPR